MLDPRKTEKIAALSVQATIDPSSIPSSVLRSSSHDAVNPTRAAVTTVPRVASETLTPSTGLISFHPAASPPSKRISASATIPIVLASSTSSSVPPKSTSPSTSEPMNIPRPRTNSRPGTRTLPASRDTAIPSARSAPATSMRLPSSTRRVYGGVGDPSPTRSRRAPRAPTGRATRGPAAPLPAGLSMAIHPCRAHSHLLCRPDVVLEAERHVEDLLWLRTADVERLGEVPGVRLVGANVLRHHHGVELHRCELAQGLFHDVAVGVREDHQAQARLLRPLEGGDRVGKRLPALHGALECLALTRVPAVPALSDPCAQGVVQHVGVGPVLALDALELDLLPPLAQLPARPGVGVAVAPRQVVQERGYAALPVHEGAVAVEGGDFDRGHAAYT